MSRQLLIDSPSSGFGGPFDKAHLLCVEDCHSVRLSFHDWRWRIGAMPPCVTTVLSLAAAIEVVRVAAASVATAVVDLAFSLVAIEQSKGGAVGSADSLATKGAVTPVAVSRASHTALPFPALIWKTDSHLANEVFPWASGPYDAPHQPVSIRLVTPQGLQSAEAPKLYRWL